MPKILKTVAETDASLRVMKHWHEAVPNDRMAHLVKDLTREFLRALQSRLLQHNVQLGHWTFLRILWEGDGVTKRELSLEAGVMEPTTVVALRSMEELGYITLARRGDNRKNIYVYLTPAGRKLRKTLVPLAEKVNEIALRGIGEQEVATTRTCLLWMLDNLVRESSTDASERPLAGRRTDRRTGNPPQSRGCARPRYAGRSSG